MSQRFTTELKPATVRRTLQRFWSVTREQPLIAALSVFTSAGYILLLTFANTYVMGLIVDRVQAGPKRQSKGMALNELRNTAYHEGGHALVAAALHNTDPVTKVTILPRGRALGYTAVMPTEDRYSMSRNQLLDQMAYAMGGRTAEEVVFHDPTTGASNDIEQATKIARAMITRYGMTDEFDMVAMETVSNQYLGGDASLSCSADTQKEIDEKVVELVKREHEKAKKILTDNRKKLDELAMFLYEKETITGEEFMKILNNKEESEEK